MSAVKFALWFRTLEDSIQFAAPVKGLPSGRRPAAEGI